jgi:uncharacterized protein (DUF2147 family)
MKNSAKLTVFSACALLLAASVAPPAAEGVQGEWRNTKNTVHMRVAPCGAALCGTVTWAADAQRADARKGSGKELVGSVLLRELTSSGDATWRGKIYIPDLNTNASATVTQLSPKLLRISGCSLMGLACRTQHWHRIG